MTPPALMDSAHADDATQRIAPAVELAIGYSSKIERVRLRFTVRNGAAASNGIEWFEVAIAAPVYSVHSPPQWSALYAWVGYDHVLFWSDLDTLTAAPPGNDGQKFPSPYAVLPGDSALAFVMFTRTVPAVIHWYAQGFDTIPGMDVKDAPEPFERGWTGTIHLDVPARWKGRPGTWAISP